MKEVLRGCLIIGRKCWQREKRAKIPVTGTKCDKTDDGCQRKDAYKT